MERNSQQLPLKMIIPDELTYKPNQSSRTITLLNLSSVPLVFKIKTNHRSCVSISESNGFIMQKMAKQIPVKLVEFQQGIKLQINYAIANKQMLQAEDSRFPSTGSMAINKQFIRKHVIQIRVERTKQGINQLKAVNQKQSNKQSVFGSFLESKSQKQQQKVQQGYCPVKVNVTDQEFHQKNDTKNIVKQQTQKYFIQAQSQQISLSERPDQQDVEQIQQQLKKSQEEMICFQKQVESYRKSQKFIGQYNIWIILGFMSLAFLLGGALKSLLMNYS